MDAIPASVRLGCAILLYGTALPASRMVSAEMPVIPATLLRMGAAALVLAPVLWFRRREVCRMTGAEFRVVFLVGLTSAVFSGLMLCTTRLVPCSIACTVAAFTPAVTAVGGTMFFRDKPNRRRFLWILAGPLGLAAFVMCNGCTAFSGTPLLLAGGLVLGLAAVCCEAAGTLLSKLATRTVKPLTVTALSTCAAALLLLPLAALQSESMSHSGISLTAWTAVVWWGAAALGLGTWLWYDGVSKVRTSTAAAWLSTLPFVTFGLNLLFF